MKKEVYYFLSIIKKEKKKSLHKQNVPKGMFFIKHLLLLYTVLIAVVVVLD